MLDDLRRVFRESVAAFLTELGKREPEDEVAELLAAMRRELVDARAALPEYEAEATRTEAELRRERELLEQCRRRLGAAERIGDGETARVAAEFAGRHAARCSVLERKLDVAREELALRTREAEEMMRRYREADANRFAMVARLRTARAAESLGGLLDEDDPPQSPSAADVEARLSELKRRMGRE